MKKNVMKTLVAAVCVVAAGVGGMKAYDTANQSKADMLLAENVEALSDPEEDMVSEGSEMPTASSIWDCCEASTYKYDKCFAYYYNTSEGIVMKTFRGVYLKNK